jgi:molybdopterin molybdotransferase
VNAYTLGAQVRAARAEAEYLGIIPDREEPLRARIRAGLAADVLILSGGISAGEFDLVPNVLAEEGVTIHFRKMRVRPGHPVLFGTRGRTLVFGLPGNPISTLYAFDQYVLPAVRVIRHHPRPQTPLLDGRLAGSIRKRRGWLTFVACTREWRESGFWLTPLATRGSADIFAIAGADSVALIPEDVEELPAGSRVVFRKLFQE